MNIIFLDIDGVITSARTGWHNWDIYAVNYLRWICKNAPAQIVITSTWRMNKDESFFKSIFGEYLCSDWMTPIKHEMRGKEIEEWIYNYKIEIDKYLILDDDTDFLEYQKENFIKTNFTNGLLWEEMHKIKKHFGIKRIYNKNTFFICDNMFEFKNREDDD